LATLRAKEAYHREKATAYEKQARRRKQFPVARVQLGSNPYQVRDKLSGTL
jgi:hypothetical protein